jgi:HAD superfamily hydrolase (TIGR01509 family)
MAEPTKARGLNGAICRIAALCSAQITPKKRRISTMKIEAILFDMDGVLVDARDWHYVALNRALKIFGFEIGRDEHLATFDGLPTREKLRILSKSRGVPPELHEFLNALKQRYTEEIIATNCKPIFHIQYALSRLRTEGYRIAVCSNSVRNTVQRMMDLLALTPYLDFFLSNEDTVRAKPHPQIYLDAMSRLCLQPASCLIVEDNVNGVRAALASGANILEVGGVEDVTYDRIVSAIASVDDAERV